MKHFSEFSSQDWATFFVALQTLVFIIGAILALRNLKIISKTHKLGAIEKFINDLSKFEKDREFLYQKFNFDVTKLLSNEEERRIKNVINSINRISMLIDNNLISAEIVFAMCHTMLIRSEYRLSPYIINKESQLGGRYGRRIIKLAKRAKQYHDSNSHHRISCIKLHNGTTNIEIYKTEFQAGFLTKRAQKLEWWMRNNFGWY